MDTEQGLAVRVVFERGFLNLLAGWKLRQALLVAVLTVAGWSLARSQLPPRGLGVATLIAVGLLLLANLLLEIVVERRLLGNRLLIGNVLLYLLILTYFARS